MNDSQSSVNAVWKQTKSKDNYPNFWGRSIYKSGSDYVNITINQNSSGVYQISTATDLMNFADLVNTSEGETLNAVLTNDIDLSGVEWKPIGVNYGDYVGTFDGQNHTISNMNLTTAMNGFGGNPTYDYQGLFGVMRKGAVIKNFTLSGKVTLASDNMNYVGGAAGYANEKVKINSCGNYGNVTATPATVGDSNVYVGGILGYIKNTSFAVLPTASTTEQFPHQKAIFTAVQLSVG